MLLRINKNVDQRTCKKSLCIHILAAAFHMRQLVENRVTRILKASNDDSTRHTDHRVYNRHVVVPVTNIVQKKAICGVRLLEAQEIKPNGKVITYGAQDQTI